VENESQHKPNRHNCENSHKAYKMDSYKRITENQKSPHKANRNPNKQKLQVTSETTLAGQKKFKAESKSLSKLWCLMHKVTAGTPHPMQKSRNQIPKIQPYRTPTTHLFLRWCVGSRTHHQPTGHTTTEARRSGRVPNCSTKQSDGLPEARATI